MRHTVYQLVRCGGTRKAGRGDTVAGGGGGRCGESHTCMTPEGGRGPGGDLWEEPPGQKEQGEQWSRSSIMPVMLKDQQDQVSDAE